MGFWWWGGRAVVWLGQCYWVKGAGVLAPLVVWGDGDLREGPKIGPSRAIAARAIAGCDDIPPLTEYSSQSPDGTTPLGAAPDDPGGRGQAGAVLFDPIFGLVKGHGAGDAETLNMVAAQLRQHRMFAGGFDAFG